MKILLLMVLFGCGVGFAQTPQEVPLMPVLVKIAERSGVGLYSYALNERPKQTSTVRAYTSDFLTEAGELIPLEWELRSREEESFLDRVQVATAIDAANGGANVEASGYALSYSWTTVQTYCLGVADDVRVDLDRWIRERFLSVLDREGERRFVKRVGAFELLLETSSSDAIRTKAVVTMSRDDSPGKAGNGWTSYCVHESLTQGQE